MGFICIYKSQLKSENLEKGIEVLKESIDTEMVKVNFLENMSHKVRTPINVILIISKEDEELIFSKKFNS